jgi:hypothetical protein
VPKPGLTLDPFTHREVCEPRWNREHGSRRTRGVCQTASCDCVCKDIPTIRHQERAAKKAMRGQRKAVEQQMLESETNPLRAHNPTGQQEPWLKLPTS